MNQRTQGLIWPSVLVFLLLAPGNETPRASSLPAGFSESAIERPDGRPWDDAEGVVFAEDGRLFVWERAGRVWVVASEAVRRDPVIDLSNEVSTIGSLGLTGFALDPAFERNGYVYLLYAVEPEQLAHCDSPASGAPVCRVAYWSGRHAASGATIGRLVRFQMLLPTGASDYGSATEVNTASRRVLLGETPPDGGAPAGCVVTGTAAGSGGLAFGSDGTLLTACGDGANASAEDAGSDPDTQYRQALDLGLMTAAENIGAFRAQLADSLSGKILRLDPATGDGVPGNPFYDPASPRAARSRVWLLGLHDPQHFSLRPGSGSARAADGRPGSLYIGDVGSVGYAAWESLAVASTGRANFGWPLYEGVGNDPTAYAGLPHPLSDLGFVRERPAIDWFHGGADARWAAYDAAGEPLAQHLGTRAPDGAIVTGPLFAGTASVGGVWYTGRGFPEPFRDVYFHADSGGEWIKAFTFDGHDNPVAVRDFLAKGGPIRALGVDPAMRDLYYITGPSGSDVRKLAFSPTAVTPTPVSAPIPVTAPTPVSAPIPVTAPAPVTAPTPVEAPPTSVRSATSKATAATATLSHVDIGAVGATGSYMLAGGTYTVQGSGADIWGTADAFQFVYETLSGNGSITARMVSQSDTNAYAKAGVMIRAALTAGSSYTAVELTPSEGAVLEARTGTGSSAIKTAGPGVAAPYWLRLVRTGNTLAGSVSPDGVKWTSIGSYKVSMASQVYIGLAVCSHANGTLGEVVFDNVTITSSAPPPPDTQPPTVPTGLAATAVTAGSIALAWTASTDLPNPGGTGVGGYYVYRNGNTAAPIATVTGATTYTDSGLAAGTAYTYQIAAFDLATPANVSAPSAALGVTTQNLFPSPSSHADIGAVGAAGSYTLAGGTYTVQGSGADIWGTADAFQFVYETLSGNGSITARMVSQSDTNAYAKAGVMIRAALTAGSSYTAVELTPSEGAVLEARTGTGSSAIKTAGPGVAAPYWLRLVRTGNTLAGSVSPDGVKWTSIGSYTVSMASQVYIGLAVCSHANGTLGKVVFDNVTITSSAPPPPDTQPPTVPMGLAATTVTTGSIALAWNASRDLPNPGGTGVGGYYVYRNGNLAAPFATVTAGTTAYTDSGLAAATAYSYQIAAFDLATPANVSAPSAALAVTTQSAPPPPPDTQPPTVPAGLAATTVTAGSIALAWNASTDLPNPGGTGVGGYYVYRNGNMAAPFATVTAGTTAYTDSGLAAATAYSYQIAAFDLATPANVSAPSAALAVTTQSAPPPPPPPTIGNLIVGNGGSFTYAVCGPGASCGATTGFAAGALQYVDRQSPAYQIVAPVPTALNGQTFIQTAEGDSSADAGGANFLSFTLEQSATVYVAHDVQVVPLPAWLTSNFLDTGVSVANNNGSPGSTFEIYSNIYPSGAQVQLGGNTATGTTAYSMYSVIVAPTPVNTISPNPPGTFALIPNCNSAAVVGLTWAAAAANPGGLPIAGYRISRNGTPIATVSYAQTSYQDTTVVQSSSYVYALAAFDQAGNVSPALSLNATTNAMSPTGDAPYCPSTLITAMTFNFLGLYSETNGNDNRPPTSPIDVPPYTDSSDLWPVTQAADNNTYAFFGDGWGLCGIAATSATKTSFGFAKMTGPPTGSGCPSQWSNLYGGYDSALPYGVYTSCCTTDTGLILGKAGAVVAVGNDFYAVGGVWRSADLTNWLNIQDGKRPPYSAPDNHQEIISSTGPGNGGQQWTDSATDLCNATGTAANPVWGGALAVCPYSFVQFGAGYTGLPANLAGYVYLYAIPTALSLASTGPGGTYLLRVPITPSVQLLNPGAYQYFAGLDTNGNPIWSGNSNQKQAVFSDQIDRKYQYTSSDGTACAGQQVSMGMSLGEADYNPQLGRFIATAQAQAGQVAFYEAPNPWGPWSVISYANLSMANIFNSGWGAPSGGLGGGYCNGSTYVNGGSTGVHIANGFTDSTGTVLQIVFAGSGEAPASASQLGGWNLNSNGFGNSMDSFNMVQATMTVNPP